MDNLLFQVFSDDRFMDLTLYQYGYEKCLPLHSYGPAIRNHYLFHYVISGKGSLSVDKGDGSENYEIHENMGFLIEPAHINTYCADREDPWEYAWIEFDGLKAREILESAGLSTEHPIFLPQSEQAGTLLKDELFHLASSKTQSSYHLIGHLFLIMDALLSGSSSRRKTQNGKRTQFYTNEAIAFISANYPFSITVEDMANRLNLDRSYFGKIFRGKYGPVASGIPYSLQAVKGGGASENHRPLHQRHQRSGRLSQPAPFFQSLQKCIRTVSQKLPSENQDHQALIPPKNVKKTFTSSFQNYIIEQR